MNFYSRILIPSKSQAGWTSAQTRQRFLKIRDDQSRSRKQDRHHRENSSGVKISKRGNLSLASFSVHPAFILTGRWVCQVRRATMPEGSQKERVHPRYSTSGRFRGSQLPLHPSNRKSQAFEGRVKDISDGGFCVIATRAAQRSALLQGRLLFPRMPMQIPTLVQVRWIEHSPSNRHY